MNRFYEGQKVVCINDNFPVKATTEKDKSIVGTHPAWHPQKGETLVIDEMMGDEWLRFDKYDGESWNWWHVTRFRPLDEIEVLMIVEQELNRSVASKAP
jgi:hypothetical protein